MGYYRQPTLHADTMVFVAEGDLWKVSAKGGTATRLTSHPGDETSPRISPDGSSAAFTASYEGPTEVYVMPLSGGLPKRLTFDGARSGVAGWSPAIDDKRSRVIASTNKFSTLPNTQLTLIDPATGSRERIPLWQASDGVFDPTGKTLFFTRLAFQGSQTKRYKGGTAQNLWKYDDGAAEATPLTPDFPGTSTSPMWWNDRVFFLTDRDGTMEIWSMKPDGSDLKQQTNHTGESDKLLDVRGPSMDASGKSGRIVYQLGADLWLYDPAARVPTRLDIRLDSDFDQTRENWVEKPFDYLTSAAIAFDGSKAALTARGQIFIAYKDGGRLVEATRKQGVRYRSARFMPDGSVLALSDESSEVEFWTLPSNGVGDRTQLTRDGSVLRWEGVPSPDGKRIAYHDKNQTLWIFDVEAKSAAKIDENPMDNFAELEWSPDSRWLSYIAFARNFNRQAKIYDTKDGAIHFATTDRYDTTDASWSPDGKWLYLLSDRNISTIVPSPWGPLQPEPFFDKRTRLYAIGLQKGFRSPFQPWDELEPKKDNAKKDEKKEEPGKEEPKKEEPPKEPEAAKKQPADPAAQPESDKPKDETRKDEPKIKPVEIELDGLQERLVEVPVPAGNYSGLSAGEKRLFFVSSGSEPGSPNDLVFVEIANKDIEIKTIAKKIDLYQLSGDGKSLLVRSGETLAIVESSTGPDANLAKAKLKLDGWTFPVIPREEWRQMFIEAWRLERDYFYDTGMHGVDWKAMLQRYLPLVDRVATRAELSDLISQMVGELSALHIFVRGGDTRSGPDNINPASLGAVLSRDQAAGGYRVNHIYKSDPDEPQRRSPLARPGVDVAEGDIIAQVNGRDALDAPDLSMLLRNQSGKQVLLKVIPKAGGEPRTVIVTPFSQGAEEDLRYHEWQYTRRLIVEQQSDNQFGYVHLRAMGSGDMNDFARGFYPVFIRKGLIIDVRHNRGGNIDSWVLSRLLRKAWFYWQGRVGEPYWNMQLAFRGHVVVLCNERTASDGEAFSEGIKRLKIGRVIGTRTWGGEIWLSSSNFLVDNGIATAAEYGVYGPEGEWLIEGHGVEPDEVVDNLPRATFDGEDAQLKAAIAYLKKRVQEAPIEVPPPPKHPDKSFK
ncbi:tricorn protease [Phycisphaerales bacterium]|nr:tricorn protease [Phycisphaerales bacterium]